MHLQSCRKLNKKLLLQKVLRRLTFDLFVVVIKAVDKILADTESCTSLSSIGPRLLFMVALGNRETIYIFILFLSSFFFFLLFFPRLISAVGDWMFTILWHMVWP